MMIDVVPIDAGDDVAGLEARVLARDPSGPRQLISAPCGVPRPKVVANF